MSTDKSVFATRWGRFIGHFVDQVLIQIGMIVGSVFGGFVAALMSGPAVSGSDAESTAALGVGFGMVFWGFAAWFLNFAVLQGLTGASLGKMIFGLRVVNADGSPIGIAKSIGRTVCYGVSGLPLYLGYLAILWSERNQCWHDSICGTVVIRKGVQYPALVEAPVPVAEQPISMNEAA